MPPYSSMPVKLPDWLSAQQRAICECVATEQCHLVVNAGAGTGKTTTSVEALRVLPRGQTAAMLAFNKPIADYMATKVPPGTVAKTYHSITYGAVRNQWPFLANMSPNTDRTWQMLPESIPGTTRRLICRLVSICKNQLVDGTDSNELLSLCTEYDIDLYNDREGATRWGDTPELVLNYTPQILQASKTPTAASGIDFDDMLWLPVIWQLPMRKFDFLVVDESQDLNKVQHVITFMVGKRIMIVGDRHQAIYKFRGASASSMDDLANQMAATPRGVKHFPLTVTRRCPILGVALARTIVPEFDYPLENTQWEQQA